MTDVLRGRGDGFISASPFQTWVRDHASGKYTDVVRAWLDARSRFDAAAFALDAEAVEAVGWSLVLTKNWDGYATLRADVLQHAGPHVHATLLSVLDAWRAVQDARYDTSLHAARSARAALLGPGAPARTLGQALRVEGVALLRMGRYEEAEAVTRQALALFEMADDALAVSYCATNLGLILNARGEIRAARAELLRSVAALQRAGAAEERLALARVNLAVVELHLGHVTAARELFAATLAVFERLDLRTEAVTARNGLGHCERALGNLDAAAAQHRAALRACTPQLARQIGLCHEFLGQVALDRGDRTRAETHYRRALDVAAHIAPEGDLMLEVAWHLAELLALQGREEARAWVERAEALCAASHERRELGCVQRARAVLLASADDPAARPAFEAAAATLSQAGRVFELALTLAAQARFETRQGQAVRACALFDQAAEIFARLAPRSSWVERMAAERAGAPAASQRSGAVPRWGFCTCDPDLEAMLDEIPALACTGYPVLVEGESGTGKEIVARALHAARPDAGPFVAVNCAALPRDLFESELFGHARGAFSGAQVEKPGLFEQADGGTLLLDEIGEMPLDLQAKLLRVLDDGLVRRVGDVRARAVAVRVVACTNRPLAAALASGRFRADLYHRLAVHHLLLKPLRERPGDIELLARYILEQEGLQDRLELTAEFLADLEARPWPGNVRELRNHLLRAATQRSAASTPAPRSASLRTSRASLERRAIESALLAAGGNVAQAARNLRLHVTTLRRKMRALGVRRPA